MQTTLENPQDSTQATPQDSTLSLYRQTLPSCLIVKIMQDEDCPNPLEESDGQWTLYSWHSEHQSKRQPEFYSFTKYGNAVPNLPMMSKLRVGLAFPLSLRYYSSSSPIEWSLETGETNPAIVEEKYDGLLVWEHPKDEMGAKSYSDRAQDAKNTLQEYNDWCNGVCYGYSLQTENESFDDSCWGYIGDLQKKDSYMMEEIRSSIKDCAETNGFSEVNILRPKMRYEGYFYESTAKPTEEEWEEATKDASDKTLFLILEGSITRYLENEQINPFHYKHQTA